MSLTKDKNFFNNELIFGNEGTKQCKLKQPVNLFNISAFECALEPWHFECALNGLEHILIHWRVIEH